MPDKEPLAFLRQPSSTVHSWPYWATRATAAVNKITWLVAGGFAAFAVFLIASFNPSVPLNWGWGTVEHIADSIPFHDFAGNGLTAMASSGPWLALAAPGKGLVLFHRPSRVSAAYLGSGVIDVAPGITPGTFLALESSGGIASVARTGIFWHQDTWLPAPASPRWKTGSSVSPGNILWAELDDDGLFLAARGGGIARNQFARSGDTLERTRNWLPAGGLASCDLDHIVGVKPGFWLTLRSGGIRFADHGSLAEVSGRSANTSPISHLSASKSGDWAAAVDKVGSAWFFQGAGWSGPWFGALAPQLVGASSVSTARLTNSNLWMGATSGLFRYDTARRSMSSVVPGSTVRQIDVVSTGILASVDAGLYFASPDGPPRQLDTDRPVNLQVSPSGDTAVYWARNEKSSELSLRAILQPGASSSLSSLRSGSWHVSQPPAIVSVEQAGSSVMLATSSGCFTYDASSEDYQDCSTAVSSAAAERRFTISRFEHLTNEDGALLAGAEGKALLYRGDHAWTVLDPARELQVRRWTGVSGQAFGLTAQNQIVGVDANGKPATRLGGSVAPFLNSGNGPFQGDLSGESGDWRTVVALGRHLVQYTSANAAWSENLMPFEPRHVSYFGDGYAAVTPWGSLATGPGWKEVFGSGGLLIPPAQVSALADGADHSILVGGPDGQVSRYFFNSGSWQNLPSLPAGTGAVVRLQNSSYGLWSQSFTGEVFNFEGSSWTRVQGVTQWAVGGDNSLWTVGPAGLSVTRPGGSGVDDTFSDGDGMRQFADRASYVWQPEPDRVVLIASGALGVFDRRADKWWELDAGFGSPVRILPATGGVIIFDGKSIELVSRNLSTSELRSPLEGAILDIAPSASGTDKYWVLGAGIAVECRLSGLVLDPSAAPLRLSPEISSLAEAAHANSRIHLSNSVHAGASLAYGGEHLDWWVDAGRVGVAWRDRPGLPVWGSYGGRLAVQCIYDVVTDASNSELLLTSDFGLLRRSQSNYSLLSAEPGSRRNLNGLRSAPTAAAGPLIWSISPSGLIASSKGRSQYQWLQIGGSWRLDCDIVDDLRTGSAGTLVLLTRGLTWAWSAQAGRTNVAAVPPPRHFSIQTPAIRASVSSGMLSFIAFDHGPPIVDGRFFFDAVSDIQGQGGALYLLVGGGRAVVRRAAGSPGKITGAWGLPNSVGSGVGLVNGAVAVRIAGTGGTFELAELAQTSVWRPASPLPRGASTGPFRWARSGDTWAITLGIGDQSRTISKWWARDRFSWDNHLSAGALDGGRVVISTPIGFVVRAVRGGVLDFLPAPPFSSSAMARSGGKPLGTVFGQSVLFSVQPGNRFELEPAPPGWSEFASVVLDSFSHPTIGRVFAFREEWRSALGSALDSRVAALPSSTLIHDGRFVFDAPSSAAVIPNRRRLTVTGCGSPAGCLAARFAESGGALFLTDVTPLAVEIGQFMAASDGRLFGLASGPRAFLFEVTPDALRTLPTRIDDTGDAFAAGHAVRLDIDRLSFSAKPVRAWDNTARLISSVPHFPVFIHLQEGAAFSFDELHTLALDPVARKIAVGTAGGVFLCPAASGPSMELARSCSFSFHALDRSDLFLAVNRLRPDAHGTLWARLDTAGLARLDNGEWRIDNSSDPFSSLSVGGVDVRFRPGFVKIGIRSFQSSNNAWWLGRRSFSEVVDSSFDASSGTLWLCDRSNGLFVLSPSRIH